MRVLSKKARQEFINWGQVGGKKRARNLLPVKRQEIARHAAQKRWRGSGENQTLMPSVRLDSRQWKSPVYIEEVLLHGGLPEWRELWNKIVHQPFGDEARALEKVLNASPIYGATPLWRGMLNHLQGVLL